MDQNNVLEELLKEIKLLNNNLKKINITIDEYKLAKGGADFLNSFIKNLSDNKK